LDIASGTIETIAAEHEVPDDTPLSVSWRCWMGAVVPYLALAATGLISRDVQVERAAYYSMALIGWYVLVPLSLAALITGLVQSLGTRWGLVRHW
jgi:hypothetical protein